MMSHFEMVNSRCSSSRTILRQTLYRRERERKKTRIVYIDTLKLIIIYLYEMPIKVSLNFHARMLVINKERLNLNGGVGRDICIRGFNMAKRKKKPTTYFGSKYRNINIDSMNGTETVIIKTR